MPSELPRKTRRTINEPGDAHELTFSCDGRQPYLLSDELKQAFLNSLGDARRRLNFQVWAYVLMPEHVHLLLFPLEREYSVAKILQAIKAPVARHAVFLWRTEAPEMLERVRVPRPSGRVEHRFWLQGGGYDRNLRSREAISDAIDYIHENPVRRELAEHPAGYRWSSSEAYGGCRDVPFHVDRWPG